MRDRSWHFGAGAAHFAQRDCILISSKEQDYVAVCMCVYEK